MAKYITDEREADILEGRVKILTPKQERRWKRRVDEAAKPMIENLQHLDMNPEFLSDLSHLVAADVLWHLDQMKKPGIMHQVLRRNK